MAGLIKAGKIRHYGLSNETTWGVCEFLRVAREHGLPPPLTIQNAYNLLNRMFDGELAEASFREKLPLLAYSPLAMGMLTGKFADGAMPPRSRLAHYADFGERYKRELARAAADEYLPARAKPRTECHRDGAGVRAHALVRRLRPSSARPTWRS